VPAALTATPGRHFVNTLNPIRTKQDNGLSNTIAFIVTAPANPVPVLTSISPVITSPGSADVTLTVTGSSFVQNTATNGNPVNGSIVVWNTTTTVTNLATTFGSASQLTATVPASLLTTESCASVAVFTGPAVDPNNPTANGGGGTSNAKTFTISGNATFCPAASQAAQSAMAVAEETPAVSLDGRFVAFAGTPNGQQNATAQIFLRDTCEGAASDCKPQTSVLSAGEDGAAGNADSHTPSISADGRFIAFSSAATNLVADTPSGKQIFLRDTCHGAATSCKPQTQLVSVDPNGLLSATDNLLPSVSSSGRFVAFLSVTASKTPNAKAPNAQVNVGQMNTGVRQVFVRDTCIGATGPCTQTWRTPVFIWPTFTCALGALAFGVLDAVTDKNATKRPDELTDGNKLSVALSNPFGSTETNCVCGLHDVAAPWQVSRRKICFPLGVSATRFVAAELKAMKRPSALMEGVWLSALPAAPSSPADNTDVCGLQSLAAP